MTPTRLLGADSSRVVFVAVVANPIYRTTALTNAFDRQEGLEHMRNWLFLTGSLSALEHVWGKYGIEADVLPAGAMVAHSDLAYLIDARGHTREVLSAEPGRRLVVGIVVVLGVSGRRARACDPHVRGVRARTPLVGGAAAFVASAFVLAACSNAGDRRRRDSGRLRVLDRGAARRHLRHRVRGGGRRSHGHGSTIGSKRSGSSSSARPPPRGGRSSTPTGVADNGGLVVSTSSNPGAGRRCHWPDSSRARTSTSRPSPRARTRERRGRPGFFPQAWRRSPTPWPFRRMPVVGRPRSRRGGEVLTSTGDASRWSKLVEPRLRSLRRWRVGHAVSAI